VSLLEDALALVSSNLARASLGMDPAMRGRLKQIDGRSIRIDCTMPALTLYLVVHDGEISVRRAIEGKPQVAVSGSGLQLANWLAAPHRIDGISIEGDETVLLEVTAALRAFDPDLLTPFTAVFGLQGAQTLLGGAELAVSALKSAAEGVGHAIEQTAASRFVTRADTNALLDALDELRLRIDRLAARISEQEERQR